MFKGKCQNKEHQSQSKSNQSPEVFWNKGYTWNRRKRLQHRCFRDFSEQFFYKTLLSSVCHWTSQLNKLAIPVNLVNSNKFRTENDGPLLKVISFETTGQYETDMIYIFLNLFKTWDQRMYVGLDCKVLRQRRKTC